MPKVEDALFFAWSLEDLLQLHQVLNALEDGWKYELRLPNALDELPFFDVLLRSHALPDGFWIIETGVYFKEADQLKRTDARSFWSWDHSEALLRAHLKRIALLCSSPSETLKGIRTLGTLLARRNHPLDHLIASFRRLNPLFLTETSPSYDLLLSPDNHPPIIVFGEWHPPTDNPEPRLSGTIPFLGERNEEAKRIVGEFLRDISLRLNPDSPPEVSVNNVPFKSLRRILPVAKMCPPVWLSRNMVYKSGGKTPSDICGLGQVGNRPLLLNTFGLRELTRDHLTGPFC